MNPTLVATTAALRLACLAGIALAGTPTGVGKEPMSFPCNDLGQVRTLVSRDDKVTTDGDGSLKVEAAWNANITIIDQKNLFVPRDHMLWCTVKVKCAGVKQRAYLEMWCESGEGSRRRSFSKGLDQPLHGDQGWAEIHLPMLVEGDFVVVRALLNVVIEGPGAVWVDSVKFEKVKGRSFRYTPGS